MDLSAHLNLWLFKSVFGWLGNRYPPNRKNIQLTKQSRVLMFAITGLGDGLNNSAATRALAETYPGIFLAMVVHHRRPYIGRRNPFLSKVYLFQKGPLAFLSLWRRLHSEGPWDAILYLHTNDPEARCLGYLLNRGVTVGLPYKTEFSHLCAWNVPIPQPRSHIVQDTLEVAAAVGARPKVPRTVYKVTEDDQISLTHRLTALGFPQKPDVVFQLGGGGAAYRDWPIEYFAELALGLQAAGNFCIFALGGPDHVQRARQLTNELQCRNGKFYDAVGKLNFYLSAALLERCECLVSTDTGIMHLGFAMDVPTVALLHCHLGKNWLQPSHNLHYHEIVEIPRPPNYHVPSDVSMSLLQPREVLPRVLAVIQRKKQREQAMEKHTLLS